MVDKLKGDAIDASGNLVVASVTAGNTQLHTTGITISNVSINTTSIAVGNSSSNIAVVHDTIRGPATMYIDPSAVGDNTGLLIVKGDLQVDGTTTTINSTTVTVDDKNIVLASGAVNNAAADGAGITVDTVNANITYNSTSNTFDITRGLNVTGAANVSSTLGVAGALSAGNTTITGNLVSNTISLSLAGTQNTTPLNITLTGNGDFLRLSSALNGDLTANGGAVHVFGKSDNARNVGYIGFKHLSNGSNNNYVTVGLHSADHILQINGSREVSANAANMYVGGTGERHHIRIASNNWPEIRYSTPTRDEIIRLGVAHADDTVTYGILEGDWYVYSGNTGKMPLKVRMASNEVVVDQYMSMPANPMFWAWNGPAGYTTTNSPLPFASTSVNLGSCYNTSTYKFTAPIAGYYEFNAMALFRQSNVSGSGEIAFYLNNNNISSRGFVYAGGGNASEHYPCHIMLRVNLAASDTIDVRIQRIDTSGVDFYLADRLGWFSGVKIG